MQRERAEPLLDALPAAAAAATEGGFPARSRAQLRMRMRRVILHGCVIVASRVVPLSPSSAPPSSMSAPPGGGSSKLPFANDGSFLEQFLKARRDAVATTPRLVTANAKGAAALAC